MLVTVITPSNASVFPEYIIPNIKYVVQDLEVSVRCAYAQCLAQLADTAVRYLEMGQALKAHGAFKLTAEAREYEGANFEVSFTLFIVLLVDNYRYRMTRACKNCRRLPLRSWELTSLWCFSPLTNPCMTMSSDRLIL